MALEENGGFDFSLLGENFSVDEMSRMQSMIVQRRMLTENGVAVFLECVKTLKEQEKISSDESKDDGIDSIMKLLEKKRAGINQNK